MGEVMFRSGLVVILSLSVLAGCSTSSPIRPYTESESAFREGPTLASHEYPDQDVYRIYHRGATGFVSVQSLRQTAEQRAQDFAMRQGKSFVVLGEKISQPPYILGNFPRIEIVFALIDEPQDGSDKGTAADRYEALERLKALLHDGAISQDEYDREKAKILE